ncbi:hypothetical protein KCP70_00545 [Salmonella enterica subsp. enterica]|nr:hypothetical protein KCP70_00545 [Salmonella enterica subsp. enterica]
MSTLARSEGCSLLVARFEETLTVVARVKVRRTSCARLAMTSRAGLFSGFYEHCPILSAPGMTRFRNNRPKTGAAGERLSGWTVGRQKP